MGGQRGLLLAANHPDRVEGAVFIGPAMPFAAQTPRARAATSFDDELDSYEGWAKYNRHYWLSDYAGFLSFFFSQIFTEPHSTKQIEDCIGWGLQTTPETLIATQGGTFDEETARELAARVRCPVLVIHGLEDAVRSPESGATLAELTGGAMVGLEGSGHAPHARDPVKVNLLLRDFVSPAPPAGRWARGRSRRRRALFISSPIGLGHARRDVAIADELRALHPELEIDWLAQHPVTAVLEARGERIHPASADLANESHHIESESAEHDLHCFQAWRRMDEILCANFMVFHDLVRDSQYDLWIGDEAWELDYYLHENPELKSAAYVWLTDFVGWLPMADGGEREALLTADYNAEMIEHIARYPRLRDQAIFVGDAADVVPDGFGPGLPRIRDWTEQHYEFAGYVTGFDPAEFGDRERLRAELGFGADEQVCVVTVGGSGVGGDLLRRVIVGVPGGETAGAGPADDRRRRPAHRPGVAAGARRTGDPGLRPRPLPRPGGLRPRRRPGRADDVDGADGEREAVPVLPARSPLRAELPRPSQARALPRRPGDGLRDGRPGGDRGRDRGGDRTGSRLRGRRPGRRRAGGGVDRGAPLGGDRPQRRWRCRGVTRRDTERSTLLPWMSTARMLTL